MKPFSDQFRLCNEDGTCQHMSKVLHDTMPKSDRKRYSRMVPPKFFGPAGPLFCGASPGVCSSSHCPKRKEGE